MDKIVIRMERPSISSAVSSINHNKSPQNVDENVGANDVWRGKRARTENECDGLINDPALRKAIDEYDPLVRDDVRRGYVAKGPCQPSKCVFPRTGFGKKSRSFQPGWFWQWEWLEYSFSTDSAFCFWCYLFRDDSGRRVGSDVFVKTGFRNWKKGTEKLKEHEGRVGSRHNDARASFFALKDQMQSFSGNVFLDKHVGQRLTSLGHYELAGLPNSGNLCRVLDRYNPHSVVVACVSESKRARSVDIGDKFFSVMIEKAFDSKVKERMDVLVRYVNNDGVVMERFLGVINVVGTTTLSLKNCIDELFAKHGFSISKLRGQSYNKAFSLQGELNELKALILNENPCAKYVHCFAHQLDTVLVAVSQKNQFVSEFIELISMITNMVGACCKKKDKLQQKQHEDMVELLEKGECSPRRDQREETNSDLQRATRWGSHYTTFIRLQCFWPSAIQVLENIFDHGTELNRGFAASLVEKMESYQFVFILHLMARVLGSTNCLSRYLLVKDRNIIGAMCMVRSVKRRFHDSREKDWDKLLEDVNDFCVKNNVVILNMEDKAAGRFLLRADGHDITYYHHFRVCIFDQIMDQIVEELENRFSESSIELLTCAACLDPKNSFSDFCDSKVLQLADLYPEDFSICDQMDLKEQLKMWICEVSGNEIFSNLQDIGALAKKMVEVGLHTSFRLVYRLIELVLVLPILTATVER